MKRSRVGIILAAGLGSRLCPPDSNSSVKPLIFVDSIALLLRTIQSLEIAHCDKVIIVLGWQADKIRDYIHTNYTGSLDIEFTINPNFHLKNGISVLCAKDLIDGEFILTMADHILSDKIMLLSASHSPPDGGATLCVDYKIETIFDLEDATKVCSSGSYIKNIGKRLTEYNCIDTGVFIGTEGLFEVIEEVYNKKGDASLSEGVQLLADKGLMIALDIKDAYWQDVDNYEMLIHAENLLSDHKKSQKTV